MEAATRSSMRLLPHRSYGEYCYGESIGDGQSVGNQGKASAFGLAGNATGVITRGQKSALPGVRGNGMTSRMLPIAVRKSSSRSSPKPKPACGIVP